MRQSSLNPISKYLRDKTRRQVLSGIVALLSAVVVLGVGLNLVQPAETMTTICGKEEHSHNSACYTQDLSCGREGEEGHVHTSECYKNVLTCGREEHTHTESCYPKPKELPAEPELAVETAPEAQPEAVKEEAESPSETGQPEESAEQVERGEENAEPTDNIETADNIESSENTDNTEVSETGEVPIGTAAEDEPAEEAEPTETADVVDLSVSAQADMLSCFAGDEVSFRLSRGEGAEEATCRIVVKQGDIVLYESEEFSDTVSVQTQKVKNVTAIRLQVTLTSANGETVAEAEIPCAVHDPETRATWERTMRGAELTGEWPADLLTIAQTQLGYRESEIDFIVREDGSRQGWTRYGAAFGMPYEEWCAMFVSFGLNYAEVPKAEFPRSESCQRWIGALRSIGLYANADRYGEELLPGDLVFFDWEKDGTADHVGIFVEYGTDEKGRVTIRTLEGNHNRSVGYVTYLKNEETILGYGLVNEAYEQWLERQEATEAAAEAEAAAHEAAEDETKENEDAEDETAANENVEEKIEEETENEETSGTEDAGETPVVALTEAVSGAGDEAGEGVPSEETGEVAAEETGAESGEDTDEESEDETGEESGESETAEHTGLAIVSLNAPESAVVGREAVWTFETHGAAGLTFRLMDPEGNAAGTGLLGIEEQEYAFVPELPGEYRFELTAVDGEGETVTESAVTVAEVRCEAGELNYVGTDYSVRLSYGEDAGIPVGAEIAVREIVPGTEEYEAYWEQAGLALELDKSSAAARFFDITILFGGEEIEPTGAVQVEIVCAQPEDLNTEAVKLDVVHIDGEGDATVLDAQDNSAAEDEGVTAASFETDSFSVFGVVYSKIEKNVLASDGHNYKITVTCGTDSGIPEDADLAVEEILRASELYEEYVAKAESALGLESSSAEYIRLFDISIVDKDDPSVKYQPVAGSTVDVRIELLDSDSESLSVVHFSDENDAGAVVDAETEQGTVSFVADGFSAYAIVEGPAAVPIGWRTITSVDELTQRTEGLYIGHKNGYYFTNTTTGDNSRTGIKKTKPAQSYPASAASKYFFEAVAGSDNQVYAYCFAADGETRQYVYNGNNNSLSFTTDPSEKTAFTVSQSSNGSFTFSNGNWYWNMQGGEKGERFCSYNSANDQNNEMNLWYYETLTSDPYELGGKSYGLMNWNGGVTGKAMMASAVDGNALEAKPLTVLSTLNNSSQLFVPNDSDISLWSFEWISDDLYYLSAQTSEGMKYLAISPSGLAMVDTQEAAARIQVVPGTGVHTGEICLKAGDTTLTYSGLTETGFSVGGSAGNEWLHLVELSDLTNDYFMTYSAKKVSISDANITTGSKIILYTRSWNEQKKAYEFFAVDHNGTLVPCFETGDSIEWVGNRTNTLLWQFTEYEDDGTPNGYFELFNLYSQQYLGPKMQGNTILSADPVGINMKGRQDGQYYSTILAWDDPDYAYAGLKVENGQVVPCPRSEAMDFYFAEMEDIPVDDTLHTVGTVNNDLFGITMKIVNFDTRTEMSTFLDSNAGGAVTTLVQGLLSTNLGADGYPTAKKGSLGTLFAGAQEVNHLFIESIYNTSGYFEYDSAENFASLNGDGSSFTVYKELGTNDIDHRTTLQHGQFFPFNDIEAGTFTSVNRENMYATTGGILPDGNPRKYEQLYLVKNTDYYFGVELEASFTQTPNGLDAWGHDIIFEFTGDDDFWLYVDDELVIDLGGIHSAVPGSVNFRTGEVNVNGRHTTLRDLFYNNAIKRGATADQAQEIVASKFVQNADGKWVFKDYTDHTMRIFYMERGAGASNLHMRFNLAAVKKGTAQLTKTVSGIDQMESMLAEFPYQIWYKKAGSDEEYLLQNFIAPVTEHDTEANPYDYVFYEGTSTPVKFMHSFTVPGTGLIYDDVFFLKPDESVEINFPEGMTEYRIVECAVNTAVYDQVTVYDSASIDGRMISGTATESEGRKDFGIDYATTEARSRVHYDNQVNPDAIRNVTFTKKLYDETGEKAIQDDDARFSFRLYLGTEFYVPASEEDELVLPSANIYRYHVKDPNDNYCVWVKDSGMEGGHFDSTGISEFSALTEEQKKAASFDTSINGAISKIPAWYTVEVPQVLAGTQFQIVERPWEIPDGYSYQKYVYNDVEQKVGDEYVPAITGVRDTVVAGTDQDHPHHVDICNLKGWGLRVNKTWTDADYMADRKPTYFAVFTAGDNDNLTLVPGTVRELKYTDSPQSVYWYFQTLPVPEVTDFDKYEIREVEIANANPNVNDEGVVTNPEEVTVIGEGESLTIQGKQKGENAFIDYTYNVKYDKGTWEHTSNVRTDSVTNDRPGIILKKTKWDGETPLQGAEFVLSRKDGEGSETVIGTFESGADGVITTAHLGSNVDYILTETAAPQFYYGLDTPLTIRLDGEGKITVTTSELSEESYILTPASEDTSATLTVKNRLFTLLVKKVDGATAEPLAGARFALYGRRKVGDVVTTDADPIPGYENLVTDGNGIVPRIDETLPAGLYAIKELAAPNGYTGFPEGFEIAFTISGKGIVTIDSSNYANWLTYTVDLETGSVDYVMTIPNDAMTAGIILNKVAKGTTTLLPGAEFELTRKNSEGIYATDESIEATKAGTPLTLTNGTLTIPGLPSGDYKLTETNPPAGYIIEHNEIYFTVNASGAGDMITTTVGKESFTDIGASTRKTTLEADTLVIPNTPGVSLPYTGGPGTGLLGFLGSALLLFAGAALAGKRRHRN